MEYNKFEARKSGLEVRSVKWEAGKEVGSGKFLKSHISLQYQASHFHLHTSNSGFRISNFYAQTNCIGCF